MYISYDTPLYNNNIKTIYDILKALPFKKCVKSTDLNYVKKYLMT